jgi:D-tyrosyl-tRNA(Tyr) deacylase
LENLKHFNMRVVIQRVSNAAVSVDGTIRSSIGNGLLVLAGFEEADAVHDLEWMSNKIANLRIFDDEDKVPNLSVRDTGGDIMLVSQFTLYAASKKGNRPSYIRAAKPDIAIPLYEKFLNLMQQCLGKTISTGVFGADMKVSLLNDGPVTICIDSRNKE